MTKAFTKDGEDMGLKKGTLQKLAAEDIDTCFVLGLCSPSDIDQLHLTKGQSLLVKQWVSLLNTPSAAAAAAPSSEPSLSGDTLGDSSGVEICRNYNASGCDRPVCRYSHSCAVCRVKGHPSAAHGNNQTFRPQAPPFASRPV